MNVIIKAAHFARACHCGQIRKYTGRPYIEHPARVASIMTMQPNADENEVCAAWLHDVCEDCGVSVKELCEEFGAAVGYLVEGLTNTSKKDFPSANRAERKRIDRERLSRCDDRVKVLKMIDRIDNLREMSRAPVGFRALYCCESRELFDAISGASGSLATELASAISELADKT